MYFVYVKENKLIICSKKYRRQNLITEDRLSKIHIFGFSSCLLVEYDLLDRRWKIKPSAWLHSSECPYSKMLCCSRRLSTTTCNSKTPSSNQCKICINNLVAQIRECARKCRVGKWWRLHTWMKYRVTEAFCLVPQVCPLIKQQVAKSNFMAQTMLTLHAFLCISLI